MRKSWVVLALILLGLAARLLWQAIRGPDWVAEGEVVNSAIAFARTGMLMDAYGPGHGHTAHVSPIPTIIAGGVYGLFGVRSVPSEILLALWSLGLTATSFLFTYRAFALAGASRLAALLGLAICAFTPLNFVDETVKYRVWDGALAAALGSFVVYLIVRFHVRRTVGWREVALLSALSALLFFITPAVGLAAYAACMLLTVRKVPATRWPGVVLTAAAALAVVISPWALRNQAVLGEFIPLRSNFGLELALAYHPEAAAASGETEHAVFHKRLHDIHPYESPSAFARMQQVGGEVAYARMLGSEARAWMAANPAEAARLTLLHLRQYYFPPGWFWTIYEGGSVGTPLKQALAWTISLLGLGGIGLALFRRRQQLQYLAIMALVPCLPYLLVQPVPRYRYYVYAPLVFFSAYLVIAAVRQLQSRFAPHGGRGRTETARPTSA